MNVLRLDQPQPPLVRSFAYPARVLSGPAGSRVTAVCPDCGAMLDLVQPDGSDPSRVVAICLDCEGWFLLLEVEDEWSRYAVIGLPSPESVRCQLGLGGPSDS